MTGDERAIANRIHALAEAIDDGDLDRVAAIFGDATFTLAGAPPRVGGAAFARTIERSMLRYEGGRPSTLHQITNLTVVVDGATATADSTVTVYQARPDLPLQAILVGRYRDRFVRGASDEEGGGEPAGGGPGGDTGGAGWRWRERAMTIDLVGDTSRHTANRL